MWTSRCTHWSVEETEVITFMYMLIRAGKEKQQEGGSVIDQEGVYVCALLENCFEASLVSRSPLLRMS